MNKYEIMFIVKPDVEEETRNALIENFKNILTNAKVKLVTAAPLFVLLNSGSLVILPTNTTRLIIRIHLLI